MSDTHFMTTDAGVSQAALTNEGALALNDCGFILTQPNGNLVPLFRAYNPSTGGHFYTIHIDEYDDCINDGSHVGEPIAGYCYATPPLFVANQPLYRGYNPTTDDHLYTLDQGEIYFQYGAYQFEGIACYVSVAPSSGAPLHRLREPSGLHFYTANALEYANCVAGGFVDEGTCGSLASTSDSDVGPLYESYNPTTGGHFYTMDFAERNNALVNGHQGDGIAGYIYPDGKQPANAIKLFRAYSKGSDDHLYTTDATELNEAVSLFGFAAEGFAGWVLPGAPDGTSSAVSLQRLLGDFAENLLVQTPSSGLTSNSNYVINNVLGGTCNPILDLFIQIDIDEDLVAAGDSDGFSFQLNAQSIRSNVTGFQQYVFSLQDSTLYGVVCNFIINTTAYYVLQYDPLLWLPNKTLPKGYRLTLKLLHDEQSNVTEVEYNVFDAQGRLVGTALRGLSSLKATQAVGIAPIGSFQMNLVGAAGGANATFLSGQGRITYRALGRLRAAAYFPSCVNDDGTTQETANSMYGLLPTQRSAQLVQTFSVAVQPHPRKLTRWRKGAKLRPPLPPFSAAKR